MVQMLALLSLLVLCITVNARSRGGMGSHWRLVQLRGGADPSEPLVIRLRLPDGSTKRLQMSKTDTLQDLCNSHLAEELSKLDTDSVKLEVGGHVQSLQQALLNTSSFAAIGLKAGDWITVSATAITQPSLSTSEVKKKVSTSASKKRKLQTVADLDNARSALLKLKREKSTTQVQLRPSTERIVNRIFHSNSKNSLGLLFAPKKPAKASSSRPKPQKGSKKAVEEDEQPEKKVHEIVAIFELSPNHGIEDIKKVIGLAAACQLDCVGLLVAQSNASSTSLWAAKECLTALAFTQALNMPRDSVVLIVGNPAKEADEEVKHSKQSSKKKTKQLSIQMNDNFGVEAFQLSNQSFEAVQRGLLDLPPVESVSALHNKLSEGSSKGLTIQLKGKALIASEEVEAIDALMLAIPLPIVFQSQDTKKSTKNIKGEGAVFPSFAHDFSTPQERSTSTMQQEQVRQDFLKKLLKHVTTSKASSSKVTKQGKSLFVESVDRMRDLHLLHYLQVYLSPQTATSLAGYLVQSQAGLENLPINVQVELNMLLQSLDLSSDDDQ